MGQKRAPEVLQKVAERASLRRFFLAADLMAYRLLHDLDEGGLSRFLGCSEDALPRLALCRHPEGTGLRFRADVERIAAWVGADARRLAALLRETEALTSVVGSGTSSGWLLAARLRETGDQGKLPHDSGGGDTR